MGNLEDLSMDQLRDLLDAKSRTVGKPGYDPLKYRYFEDMEEYAQALARAGCKNPTAGLEHELSHGRCALAVGVISVRYGFEYDTRWDRPIRAITSLIGPSVIPNIAYAAILAAPSDPSPSDLAAMRRVCYRSVEYLEERITKWNLQDNGLTVPLPGTIDTTL